MTRRARAAQLLRRGGARRGIDRVRASRRSRVRRRRSLHARAAVRAVADAPTRRAQRPRIGFAFGLGLFGAGASWVYIALETFGGMPHRGRAHRHRGASSPISRCGPRSPATSPCARHAPSASRARLVAARRVDARRMAARLRLHRLPVARRRVRAAARQPARRLCAARRRVRRDARRGAASAALLALAFDALPSARAGASVVAAAAAVALFVGGGVAGRDRMDGARRASRSRCRSCRATCRRTLKFDPQFRETTFAIYAELVEQSRGRLIVLPESAFPMFSDEVPDAVIRRLIRTASARRRRRAARAFHRGSAGAGQRRDALLQHGRRAGRRATCSSIASVTWCRSARRFPPRPVFGWFIRNVLAIPLADQAPGGRARSRRSPSPEGAWP